MIKLILNFIILNFMIFFIFFKKISSFTFITSHLYLLFAFIIFNILSFYFNKNEKKIGLVFLLANSIKFILTIIFIFIMINMNFFNTLDSMYFLITYMLYLILDLLIKIIKLKKI
ncbi:MAG: hypothetical protein CMD07_02810 [Flavobacteriales bacterium]|nr:hypothetical protein [Flavobacteriales bacterium]